MPLLCQSRLRNDDKQRQGWRLFVPTLVNGSREYAAPCYLMKTKEGCEGRTLRAWQAHKPDAGQKSEEDDCYAADGHEETDIIKLKPSKEFWTGPYLHTS